MSSNFERLHEIINDAYAENFSCPSHWEPKKCHMWASISENPIPLYHIWFISHQTQMHINAKILPFSYLSVSGFSFSCCCVTWRLRLRFCEKNFPQMLHWKLFSPVWVTRWSFSFPEFLKTRKQNSQTNLLPGSRETSLTGHGANLGMAQIDLDETPEIHPSQKLRSCSYK